MASHVRPGKEAAAPPGPVGGSGSSGTGLGVGGQGRPSEAAAEASAFDPAQFDPAAPITFVFKVGQRLQLSGRVIGVASVLYHRVQMSPTRDQLDPSLLCLAVLYLAAKSEETPRDLRDVITTGFTALHPSRPLLRIDGQYRQLRESLIGCEQMVLRAVGYNLDVVTPHRLLLLLLRSLEVDRPQLNRAEPDGAELMARLARMAWAMLNDSFHTASSATVPPQQMAAGCVYAAAGLLGVDKVLYLKTYLERFAPELRWAADSADGSADGCADIGAAAAAAGTPLEQLAAQLRQQHLAVPPPVAVAVVAGGPPGAKKRRTDTAGVQGTLDLLPS